MSSLLSLPLAGGCAAGLLCRMAGRRTPDGAALGPMPGCDTTIFFLLHHTPLALRSLRALRRCP